MGAIMLKKETFVKNLSEITRGMKQKEIATIMGCTESTMSKYLNPDKKDFPPVDKLYNITEHFNVSIDWLVGAQVQQEDNERLSVKDICLNIVKIYNSLHFNFETVSKYESCRPMNEYGCVIHEDRENTYLSLYFPNWPDIEISFEEPDLGNESKRAIEVNNFLVRFQKINIMLAEGNLDQEMYSILLEKYLSDVSTNKHDYEYY